MGCTYYFTSHEKLKIQKKLDFNQNFSAFKSKDQVYKNCHLVEVQKASKKQEVKGWPGGRSELIKYESGTYLPFHLWSAYMVPEKKTKTKIKKQHPFLQKYACLQEKSS